MRILALIPGGISDQLLFFPTLKTLKEQYPQAIIDVIVEPRSKNTYRVCKYVQEVLVFDFQDRNGLADYLNLLGMIRDREYELAITLEKNWAVAFLLWLDGIPVRVGYKTNNSWFINNPIAQKTEQYTASMYHDLLTALNIHTPCPDLTINVPKDDIDWAESEQQRLNLKSTGYILIHGGASPLTVRQGINKIYPVPKWQRIIEDIQMKQPNLPIVLLCGPDDINWTNEMLSLCPTVKVISPPDMGKLAAVIAGANLMLCTDSAPMQLAVAVGTYTIALFGPTQAKKLLPSNHDRFIGLQSLSDKIADIPTDKILEQMWKN
ncbi:glycosyltransferase family 9 protein [Geminocystis sp. NIES-3709]|uniref:glycosyltransferase family 9 protein n=1 Tax=Geminocystis sp. NIES-3709 TaxID=1617448 RepID=UPI0005FCCABB|nr:glycosyltransferase family 9 protein [Geminocystis sp. NIES-3709]BAQ66374.1 ADP-heptose--lipooligosaccharide heptosyltransferase II [Geminocystis sp. NIES-3709]